MHRERKSALVTTGLGLLCVGFGIAFAAATSGRYIAVGGIVFGLIMAVGGAWRFSRVGFIVLGLLLAGGVAGIVSMRRANEDHAALARKTVEGAAPAELAEIVETSDSGAMRYAAARELRRAPSRRSVEALVRALDADVTTGWHAKNEVGRFWMETVKEGPALRDPSIRGQAIESLQELGDPRALPGLIALLGDPLAQYHHSSAQEAVEDIVEQRLDRQADWAAWWADSCGRWRVTRANRDKTRSGVEVEAPLKVFTVSGIVAFRDDDSDGTALVIGCDLTGQKVERVAAIDWGPKGSFMSKAQVRYRVGDGAPRLETWRGQGKTTIPETASPLLEELVAAAGATFRAETTTVVDRPLTLTVSTEGLDKAIAKVECRGLTAP
jgi:hypothetical protein